MFRLGRMALAICAMSVLMTSAKAAPVFFMGSVSATNPVFPAGTPVWLNLEFTPTVGGVAGITFANLNVGAENWMAAGTIGSLTIVENGSAPDDMAIAIDFGAGGSSGGLGTGSTTLTMTIMGHKDLGPAPDASFENVNMIAMNPNGGNPGSGTVLLVGAEVPGIVLGTSFSGTAVPEPGTFALLGGLGLVFTAGAWRRRRRQQQEA